MYSNSLARHFSFMFHAKCLLPRLDKLLPLRSCLQNFYQCSNYKFIISYRYILHSYIMLYYNFSQFQQCVPYVGQVKRKNTYVSLWLWKISNLHQGFLGRVIHVYGPFCTFPGNMQQQYIDTYKDFFPSISYYFHIPKFFLIFFPHTGKIGIDEKVICYHNISN